MPVDIKDLLDKYNRESEMLGMMKVGGDMLEANRFRNLSRQTREDIEIYIQSLENLNRVPN